MEEYLIGDININTKKDTVFIDYLPMSRSEYYSNNYHDDGLSYKEYLGYF